MNRIYFIIYAAALVLLLSFNGCSYKPDAAAAIRIKGSDTMLLLTRQLSEEYMRRFPNTAVYVEGGGTASGVRSLIKNEIDILTASRTLLPEEVQALAEQYGALGIAFNIAKDALSIYVNEDNPVKDFTIQQLKDIFTCRVTSWNQLGGSNDPIVTVIRSPNSGTYLYFKEHILEGEEYCTDAVVKATTESITQEISENESAIGYGGIGYIDDIVHAKVNGIESSEENIRNNSYPVSRYLYFYTLNSPEGPVKDFINWVMSPEGQRIVKQAGYIPLFEITF